MNNNIFYVLQYNNGEEWIDLEQDSDLTVINSLYKLNVKNNEGIKDGFKFRIVEKILDGN